MRVSPFAPLPDDEWEDIDTVEDSKVAPEPVAPAVVPVLSEEEWEEIDAAREAEARPVEVVEAEAPQALTTAEVVKAVLTDPEALAMLRAALLEADTTKVGRATKVVPAQAAPVPLALFQAPELAA
ncbi:hypothetical protein [Sphaerisporangium perillae]|uniref:hypothetical protein n=1 Tax=Sphaerisporangium perillae TaxID=2935860 RepID=UPI00200D06DC|nr:hypothetical protein [Sphaerisporangium perillae]